MTFLEEVQADRTRAGGFCAIGKLLEVLSPADATDLRTALADPSITGAAIARALRKRDHHVSQNTVQRHRRGECKCP